MVMDKEVLIVIPLFTQLIVAKGSVPDSKVEKAVGQLSLSKPVIAMLAEG